MRSASIRDADSEKDSSGHVPEPIPEVLPATPGPGNTPTCTESYCEVLCDFQVGVSVLRDGCLVKLRGEVTRVHRKF